MITKIIAIILKIAAWWYSVFNVDPRDYVTFTGYE